MKTTLFRIWPFSIQRFALIVAVLATPLSAAAAEPNVEAGKARAAVCHACHGEKGISSNPTWPNLAGQKSNYLVKQLRAFRDGSRDDAVMSPMAKPLTDDDIINISAYYSKLAGPQGVSTSE